jgi:hypothetical protein
MIGELASFSNALSNAFTNTLGGKSTQLSSWRNTLRYSSSIALLIICFVILFNLETLTPRVFGIGFAAGHLSIKRSQLVRSHLLAQLSPLPNHFS